jgi:hypothetical protein
MWQEGYEPWTDCRFEPRCLGSAPELPQTLGHLCLGYPGLGGRGAVMAYGERLTGEEPLAYTIHVWPTRELIEQSWAWSEQRREAFVLVAGVIGLGVALQVLEVGCVADDEIEMITSLGRVSFTISQMGATIHITISLFTGPDSPTPNGGLRQQQPTAIDGLVLGLRGSNGCFSLVVFHGVLPSITTNDISTFDQRRCIYRTLDRVDLIPRANWILLAMRRKEPMPVFARFKLICDSVDQRYFSEYAGASKGLARHTSGDEEAILVPPIADTRLRAVNFRDIGRIEGQRLENLLRISEWKTWNRNLPTEVYLRLCQPKSKDMPSRYLH